LKIVYHKKFLKDLSQITTPEKKRIELFCFQEALNFKSIQSVGNIEKIQGHKNYYKIRFGNYRVGIYFQNDVLSFERVLDRKEIYRYFP
jgi:mRNA interferase RelE/StbE